MEEHDAMATPALKDDHLPMGRHVCTLDEVERAYVPDDPADRRRQIWTQWVGLTEALQSALGAVAACWLSGSFFSSKPVPGDIDCLYVVDIAHLTKLSASEDPAAAGLVYDVMTGAIKEQTGALIDSYVLAWVPTPGIESDNPIQIQYHRYRGYWDDLWSRVRDADQRLGAIPRRGYLEVLIDGYR